MDSYCAYLNSLSDQQLIQMHETAHIPTRKDTFPIRGCTMRCILGNSFAAVVAKQPHNNLGWGGKCFNFEFDPSTGVPTRLNNIFGDYYDNDTLPESHRVQGELHCRAKVSWQPTSFSDGKATYVFDHSISEEIYAKQMKSWVDVRGFRDEMRMVKPGFLLGKSFGCLHICCYCCCCCCFVTASCCTAQLLLKQLPMIVKRSCMTQISGDVWLHSRLQYHQQSA